MQRSSVKPGAVLVIVCTGVVLVTLDLFIVNLAFPSIERSFGGTSLSSLSWVLNAYAIVFAALLIPAGRYADRTSRKSGFLLGVAIFTVASAFCAAANGVEFLVAARILQAVGAALLMPSSLGLLLAAYPPERRAGAVRIWAATSGVAAALGPVLGGLLVAVDWRWIFLVNLPVGIAALIAGRRFLPAVPRIPEPRPDLFGAFVLMIGSAALTLGLVKAPDWGWSGGRTLVSLGAGLALLAYFVLRSARHSSPIIELDLFRVRAFAVSSLAMFLFSAAFAGNLLSVLVWAQTAWGWSPLRTGVAFLPGPLMVPLFAIGAGKVAHRVGPGALATLGCLSFSAGTLLYASRIGLEPNYLTAMLPGALLVGTGVGLTLPTLTATAAGSLPPQRFATGSAVITMARQVGFTVGVAVLIAVLAKPLTPADRLVAFHHGWEVVAGIGLLGAAAAVLLVRRPAPVAVPAAAR
ncbi:MAG TPA: DHA2 family efflux MFS transporter permease subunit [Gaiellaceae bacterium]|nr:DHA2 family efflux MFS transporter permease subunit [Gaiellaceae bacterium]